MGASKHRDRVELHRAQLAQQPGHIAAPGSDAKKRLGPQRNPAGFVSCQDDFGGHEPDGTGGHRHFRAVD
jgi:hypothetical protein